MMALNKGKRTYYTAEFKSKAVALSREIGASLTAEKLGIKHPQTLHIWRRKEEARMRGNKTIKNSEKTELKIQELEKEIEALKNLNLKHLQEVEELKQLDSKRSEEIETLKNLDSKRVQAIKELQNLDSKRVRQLKNLDSKHVHQLKKLNKERRRDQKTVAALQDINTFFLRDLLKEENTSVLIPSNEQDTP